ncbi:MAG: cytochrome c biogenesis protein CcdA, partial [Planctomycetota bacterium]|nr:cytochrome c biogenesis protein CcdA [Planctomycetota bacterium]
MISSPHAPRLRTGRKPALALFLAALVVASFALAAPAQAGDKASGKVDVEVALEPADAGPGSEATLVFRFAPLDQEALKLPGAHFIYAEGKKGVEFKPLEGDGVTYHVEKSTRTPAKDVKDFDEVHQAWTEPFEIRVPVTLGKDLAQGTKLGAVFDYQGCLQGVACYGRIKGQEAALVLGGGSGSMLDPAKGGAAVDPKLAAEPTESPPVGDDMVGGTVEIRWMPEASEVHVIFTPAFLHHMYGPGVPVGKPITIEPVEGKGIEWADFEITAEHEFELAYTQKIKVTKADDVKVLQVNASFQACDASMCKSPQHAELKIVWPGAKAAPAPTEAGPVLTGDVLFEVVEGDQLGGDVGSEDDSSIVQRVMEDNPALGLGLIFLFGLGLAFTPCVLPIIPITVSVITGGNADIPKKRLSVLLLLYVLGLSMAFATLGTVAAAAGGSVSALFSMPGVQWGIAILFILLAFSMIGVYELQPPAWLMKLQGGAQKRSGSLIGAFMFGVLGAIIASPCTAPAVAGMLIVTAKTGSLPLGFIMFFMLGLGMGAVFYAAGALNFLMRPGPWMVWIRYGFGVLLFGTALYYLYGNQLIGEPMLWVVGLGVSALAAYGIYWHLTTKEGEQPGPARKRGLQVAATWVIATVVISFIAARVTGEWTKVKDPAHLTQLVKQANAEGKPVVVDFWATWCKTCVKYDELIETDAELNALFKRVAKLKVDVTDDERLALRHALGMEVVTQPSRVLSDREG